MANLINCFCLLAFIASLSDSTGRLNKFISHFEVLDYETEYKHVFSKAGRRVTERSSQQQAEVLSIKDEELFISFKAFGRTFKLILTKDTATCARNAEIITSHNSRFNLNVNNLVVGRVDNETSSVYGCLTNSGLFIGMIQSRNGTYYVQPAEKFFKKASFHSVIYRNRDIQHNLVLGLNFNEDGSEIGESNLRASLNGQQHHRLKKRASNNRDVKSTPKVCRLSLEADYTFLKMVGSRLHSIRTMVSHVQSLNKIFYESFVSKDKRSNGFLFTHRGNDSIVQFQITKVRVYNESETNRVLGRGGLDAATFLRLMQEKADYSQYCLALFFTARSFTEGVLGVANQGGACTSPNSGVVSFTREGVVLPPLVTEIALAHVVGHAFGAKDDADNTDCQPGKDGDFIMTRLGVNADQANNFLYSPCSVEQITSFVNTIRDKRCLKRVSIRQSFCGNSVVENYDGEYSEECDCGDEKTCRDLEPGNCCDYKTCRLRKHALCSVSNGFCCDSRTCSYMKAGDVCSHETECSDRAVCSGNTSICSELSHKDDLLECNRNSSVCMNGVCSGKSVCAKFGLDACFCERNMDECKVCCVDEKKCRPAQNITKIKSKLVSTYLSAGSLCANRRGYCDVFHECHPINQNAPFSHRYDPYFKKKGVKEITHSFWWAIFLGTVGLTACIIMLIKHGARYTRSSNPELNELEPAKKLPRFKLSRLKEEEKEIILTDDMIA